MGKVVSKNQVNEGAGIFFRTFCYFPVKKLKILFEWTRESSLRPSYFYIFDFRRQKCQQLLFLRFRIVNLNLTPVLIKIKFAVI